MLCLSWTCSEGRAATNQQDNQTDEDTNGQIYRQTARQADSKARHKRSSAHRRCCLSRTPASLCSLPVGRGDIAASFRLRQQPADPQPHTHPSTGPQSGALQEGLFVMTASGGLVRHQLRLQHKGQAETGLVDGDRYGRHTNPS